MNAKDTPDGFLSHYLPFRNISSGNILDSLNRTAEGILCGAILLCQSQKTRQTRLHILQALQRRIVIHMVLCRQHRNGRFGVADEQRVVTDAQTDDDVQLRSGFVQQLRLRNRVAHCLLRGGNADGTAVNVPHFAADAFYLKAVVVGIVMLLSASGNARILSLFGMSVGTSVAVINYISRIFAPIESLGMEIQTIQSAMAGVRRIDAFLAQPERAMENGETAAYGDVVLSHVTFGYGEAPVLRDFSMTVKQGEQITLGDPQITEEMAKHAARLAGIDAAVQALPEGYHTPCTEGLFSQGEWQLLSIARAAAANPAVLLLDGITANLDAETEQRVLAALRRACEGRTVLSVSHRIYENLGGRTIEIGSQRNAALSHV